MPRGNLGNQMLQLMFARNLQKHFPALEIIGYNMPVWELSQVGAMRLPSFVPSLRQPDPDVQFIAGLYKRGLLHCAKIRRVPLDVSSLGPQSLHHDYFSRHSNTAYRPREDEIIINVRGGEILSNVHEDYGPMPLHFYKRVLEESGLNAVFLGQIGSDYYSKLLIDNFPNAKFIASQGILEDFTSLRLAKHLVISVSTFSWLAAWLSEARSIHFPVYGMFNPAQRPDAWFLPSDRKEYKFYWMPIRKWCATSDQIRDLTAPLEIREMNNEEFINLRNFRAAERRLSKEKSEKSLLARAVASLPLVRAINS